MKEATLRAPAFSSGRLVCATIVREEMIRARLRSCVDVGVVLGGGGRLRGLEGPPSGGIVAVAVVASSQSEVRLSIFGVSSACRRLVPLNSTSLGRGRCGTKLIMNGD